MDFQRKSILVTEQPLDPLKPLVMVCVHIPHPHIRRALHSTFSALESKDPSFLSTEEQRKAFVEMLEVEAAALAAEAFAAGSNFRTRFPQFSNCEQQPT